MQTKFALLAALVLPFLFSAPGGAQNRPNVVVILTDDQRWDSLGVVQRELGDKGRFPFLRQATPNIDALAAAGVRFRNAFVVTALCSPSRSEYLTGRYSHNTGVPNNHTEMPVGNATFATLLPAAVQGRSLVPILTDTADEVRDGWFYAYFSENGFPTPDIKALRADGMKLIQYPGHPSFERLFDLDADPLEITNLTQEPERQEQLQMLRQRLDAEATAVGFRRPANADPPK